MKTVFSKINRKTLIIAILCLCVVACTVGGVFAFLTDNTNTLSNEFVPANVTCIVEEKFDNGVKENVTVRNTGNINAYIRAAVVVTFVAEDGKVFSAMPKENVDYAITWGESDWQKSSDGYWYYKKSIAPESSTASLIKTASAISAPDGYKLNIQIFASAIQSTPATAVEEAWGVTISNGELIPN